MEYYRYAPIPSGYSYADSEALRMKNDPSIMVDIFG
jgi:hypothetical protein